jgi:hypothetical protein
MVELLIAPWRLIAFFQPLCRAGQSRHKELNAGRPVDRRMTYIRSRNESARNGWSDRNHTKFLGVGGWA